MHRLAQGDIDKLQGLLGKIYDPAAAEDFWPTAIRALAEVIPHDICAYNEVDLRRRNYAYMVEPETATFPIVSRFSPPICTSCRSSRSRSACARHRPIRSPTS